MKKTNYSVVLLMNHLEYKGEGDSLEEAIKSLGLDYLKVKTKGELTVIKGQKKASRLIHLQKLRRYFMSSVLMSGLIRDFNKLLA